MDLKQDPPSENRGIHAIVLSLLFATLLSAVPNALGVEVINHFDASAEGWHIYDYDGGAGNIPAQNVFYPVTWESTGGVGNTGYIWGDDSRWRIDTPENPHSILAYIIYRNWVGKGPVDLRNAKLSVYLRGDELDLKGAGVYFWALNNALGTRWHYTGNPFDISNGEWGAQQSAILINDESQWHRSWSRHPSLPASLNEVLANADSYGFSFLGFSEEVTGIFAMDELVIVPEPELISLLSMMSVCLLTMSRCRVKLTTTLASSLPSEWEFTDRGVNTRPGGQYQSLSLRRPTTFRQHTSMDLHR